MLRTTIVMMLMIGLGTLPRRFEPVTVHRTCPPDLAVVGPKCVAVIAGGDLVKPSFSPTERYLAFATVTVRPPGDNDESSELDGVLVADLTLGTVKLLVHPNQARKYASYSAFVGDIRWHSDQLLLVTYADGDVDWDDLKIRRADAKILATKHGSAEDAPELHPAQAAPNADLDSIQVRQLLPDLPAKVLVKSGRLSPHRTLLCVVAGNEPHRQLFIFRVSAPKKP